MCSFFASIDQFATNPEKYTRRCLQSGTLAFQANERYRCCGPRLRRSALRQEGHLASASSLARRRSPPIPSRPPRADYQLHCYILVLSGCLAGATVVLSTAKRLTRACGSPNCAGSVIPLTSRMWSRGCGSVPSAHLSAQLSFESAIRSHEAKWDRAPKKRLVREDRTDEFPGRRALFIFSTKYDPTKSNFDPHPRTERPEARESWSPVGRRVAAAIGSPAPEPGVF